MKTKITQQVFFVGAGVALVLASFAFAKSFDDEDPPEEPVFEIPNRTFLPVRYEYKNLRISDLPRNENKLDLVQLMVDTASARNYDLRSLTLQQKRLIADLIQSISSNQNQRGQTALSGLLDTFRLSWNNFDLNLLLEFVIREVYVKTKIDFLTTADRLHFYVQERVNHYQQKFAIEEAIALCELPRAKCTDQTKTDLSNELTDLDKLIQVLELKINATQDELTVALQVEKRWVDKIVAQADMLFQWTYGMVR